MTNRGFALKLLTEMLRQPPDAINRDLVRYVESFFEQCRNEGYLDAMNASKVTEAQLHDPVYCAGGCGDL